MYKQIRFQKIEFVSHDFKQVYIAACTVSRAQFLKISLDSQHTYNLVNRSLSIFSSRSCRQRQKIKNRSRYIWTISNKVLTLSVLQAAPRFIIKIRCPWGTSIRKPSREHFQNNTLRCSGIGRKTYFPWG